MVMLQRAMDAGVPFAWVTADEAYGQAKYLRVWLEQHDAAYVLATKCNDTLITAAGEQRADDLIAALPARAWRRFSVGAGAHGPWTYDWARIPIRIGWAAGRGHWLLARRKIADPTEIAYYVCYGPRRSTLLDLAWTAGSRWRIEECFAQAKNEAGLDHYQVRSWRAWYAHVTLSMLALAWLAGTKAQITKGNRCPRPAHDQFHATGDPPAARAPDPATRRTRRTRLVLVPLATPTPQR
jgi:SRSO17 transposase